MCVRYQGSITIFLRLASFPASCSSSSAKLHGAVTPAPFGEVTYRRVQRSVGPYSSPEQWPLSIAGTWRLSKAICLHFAHTAYLCAMSTA